MPTELPQLLRILLAGIVPLVDIHQLLLVCIVKGVETKKLGYQKVYEFLYDSLEKDVYLSFRSVLVQIPHQNCRPLYSSILISM